MLPKLNHSDFCPGFDVPGDLPAEAPPFSLVAATQDFPDSCWAEVSQGEATRDLACSQASAPQHLGRTLELPRHHQRDRRRVSHASLERNGGEETGG